MTFRKKVTEYKIRVLLSLQRLSETFLILRRNERDIIIKVYCSSSKVTVFCPILMELEFSRQIFMTCSNILFHENPSNESRIVPRRETDRQTQRS